MSETVFQTFWMANMLCWSVHVCCLHLKIEFCSCARGRQWCGIIHYHWWTASIKPRLLFSRAGYASWGLSLSSVSVIIFGLRFAFFTHISGKNAQFQNMCAKKRNDFRQLKRSNFRVEKCKTEENLSKFLNNMVYKTLNSMRDCVMKIKFIM